MLKESYSSSEVVLVGELMKLVISGYLTLNDVAESGMMAFNCVFFALFMNIAVCFILYTIDSSGSGVGKLIWLALHSRKVIVLVILYSIANILSYYALARVDAAVYTVMLQVSLGRLASSGLLFVTAATSVFYSIVYICDLFLFCSVVPTTVAFIGSQVLLVSFMIIVALIVSNCSDTLSFPLVVTSLRYYPQLPSLCFFLAAQYLGRSGAHCCVW